MWNLKIYDIFKISGILCKFLHLNTSYKFFTGETEYFDWDQYSPSAYQTAKE